MPVPLIAAAAAAAARVISTKLASRAVGGITGAGAKSVAKVYRETGNSVKVVKPGQDVKVKNIISDLKAINAKQGNTASAGAEVINKANQFAKAGGKQVKTIKITSK